MVRTFLVFVLGAAVALGGEYALRHQDEEPERSEAPTVTANLPDDPEDPPVVWLEGVIEEVDPAQLSLREGEGPAVTIRRFGEGATDFLRLGAGRWRQLTDSEVEGLPSNQPACVETLLDGRAFFALRVFLGARCAPV